MSQPQKCHKTESNKRKVDRLDVSTVVESPTKKSHQEDKTAKVLADKNEWKYVRISGKWYPNDNNKTIGGVWVNKKAGAKEYAKEKMQYTGEPIPEAVDYPGDELTRTAEEQMFRTMDTYSPVWMQDVGVEDWVAVQSIEGEPASFCDAIRIRASKLSSKISNGNKSISLAKQADITRKQSEIIGSIDNAVRTIISMVERDPTREKSCKAHLVALRSNMAKARTLTMYGGFLDTVFFWGEPSVLMKRAVYNKLHRLSVFESLYGRINSDPSVAENLHKYISM